MFQVVYRLTTPGVPHPFDPWFEREPEAVVHGTRFELAQDEGRGRFLGFAARPSVLAEDLEKHPFPNASLWRGGCDDGRLARFEAAWGEPIYPGVRSPMHVAWGAVGPEAILAVTLRRDRIVHRLLAPRRERADGLWTQLRDEMMRFSGFSGMDVRLELECARPVPHLAPLARLDPGDPARVGFDVGFFDPGAPVGVAEVALGAGVPEGAARARLALFLEP